MALEELQASIKDLTLANVVLQTTQHGAFETTRDKRVFATVRGNIRTHKSFW